MTPILRQSTIYPSPKFQEPFTFWSGLLLSTEVSLAQGHLVPALQAGAGLSHLMLVVCMKPRGERGGGPAASSLGSRVGSRMYIYIYIDVDCGALMGMLTVRCDDVGVCAPYIKSPTKHLFGFTSWVPDSVHRPLM